MKKTVKKTAVKKTKVKDSPYQARIKVMGRFYEAVGSTLSDVLEKLQIDGTPRGMAVLTVKNGDKERTKILNVGMMTQIFKGSRVTKEIALKNMSLIFGDL